MLSASATRTTRNDQRTIVVVVVVLALVVFALTWVSIIESRDDSFKLLRDQGVSFTESLALAAQNAINSETFYDQLVQIRYADLVASIIEEEYVEDETALVQFARAHDLLSVHVFDSSQAILSGVVARGPYQPIPEFARQEVGQLLLDPEMNFVLLLDDDSTGQATHYYLEVSSRLDKVVVVATDALFYSEVIRQTGIGYLAQRLAGAEGIEYIVYQTTDGIIFASRWPGRMLSIESDSFLTAALDSDTIMSREHQIQEETVLEMVRPFSSSAYPFGLFRVGLSLDSYHAVMRGFDRQMIILAMSLVAAITLFLLYFGARRRRKELSLQYTEIKSVTDRILEQMRTGVVVIDSDQTIRMANKAFERIFGVRDILGKLWSRVLGDHSVLLLGDDESSQEETETTIRVGESTRTLLIARSQIETIPGSQTSTVMVVYDITRLKDFERASARRERLSEMGNLAAGVAHEIRNPLNTISIAAQRLAQEFTPPEDAEQYLAFTSQIRGETSRLNEIISRFLALAREEKRQSPLVRLDLLIRESFDFLALEAREAGIEMKFICKEPVRVRGNGDEIKQVMINLFNNAKEAMPGNPKQFVVELTHQDQRVLLSASDNGPGIDSSEYDKVFAPYFTTKEAGTGLGLPTVQRIIEGIGGEVEYDRNYKDGARFLIFLPRPNDESST